MHTARTCFLAAHAYHESDVIHHVDATSHVEFNSKRPFFLLIIANLPIAIQKGDCPSTCNQHEKDAIIYVIKTLKVEYPNIWKSAVKHYKATPEQLKKLDDWITESSTSTTTSSSVSSSGSSPSSTTVTTTVPSTLVGNKEKTNASFWILVFWWSP